MEFLFKLKDKYVKEFRCPIYNIQTSLSIETDWPEQPV